MKTLERNKGTQGVAHSIKDGNRNIRAYGSKYPSNVQSFSGNWYKVERRSTKAMQ